MPLNLAARYDALRATIDALRGAVSNPSPNCRICLRQIERLEAAAHDYQLAVADELELPRERAAPCQVYKLTEQVISLEAQVAGLQAERIASERHAERMTADLEAKTEEVTIARNRIKSLERALQDQTNWSCYCACDGLRTTVARLKHMNAEQATHLAATRKEVGHERLLRTTATHTVHELEAKNRRLVREIQAIEAEPGIAFLRNLPPGQHVVVLTISERANIKKAG